MDQATLDKIILDDKRLKNYVISGIKEQDRPLFYQRCIQIRHHQTTTGHNHVQTIRPLNVAAYDTYCSSLFGHLQPSTNLPCVPDFGSPVQFRHADQLMPLSSMQQSQQSLLCLIREAHHDLAHCPFMADLITFFTRYFNDATVFSLLQLMITARPRNDESMSSYYFTLNSASFATFIKRFYLLLKNQSESTKHHLKHMGIDIATVFQSWAERCFNGFHPQSTIIRFLDGFVAFGLPWIWTWALALLDQHRKEIMACSNPNQVSMLFYNEMCESDANEVVERACSMLSKVIKTSSKFKSRHTDKYVLHSVFVPRESSNHVPRLRSGQTSEILSHDQFCAIWCWIDDMLKVTDPELLYASSIHGYSLATLLERCTTNDPHVPHGPTVTVVKSTTGAIFGIYLSNSWVQDSDATRLKHASHLAREKMNQIETKIENELLQSRLHHADGRSFVFMLAPHSRCFRQPQARQERAKKQRELEFAEADRRILRAGRDGLRSRDSRTGTSSAAHHAVDDHSLDHSYDDTSLMDSNIANNTKTLSSRRAPLSPTSGIAAGRGFSPLSPSAARGIFAAQLLQLMEAQRDELDDKSANMMCSDELIALGDAVGVAFSLDRHLKKGVSQSTSVFENENLARGQTPDGSFDCLAVEVWGFKEPSEQWTIRVPNAVAVDDD